MLAQDYAYYIYKVLLAGIPSLAGILSLIFFAAAVAAYLTLGKPKPGLRMPAFWLSLVVALALQTTAFYSAVYEYDEQPETLTETGLLDTEPACGVAWSNWAKGGYGMGNSCPSGCIRGLTLRKQLKMTGFPPWPNYRREHQCLTYEK